ncbi:hypothetical protein SedNR2807_44850 [Citrobacter sedlakii]
MTVFIPQDKTDFAVQVIDPQAPGGARQDLQGFTQFHRPDGALDGREWLDEQSRIHTRFARAQ